MDLQEVYINCPISVPSVELPSGNTPNFNDSFIFDVVKDWYFGKECDKI